MRFSINPLSFKSSVAVRVTTLSLAAALVLFAFVAVSAQTENAATPALQPAANKSQPKESKAPFTLRVTNDQIIGISLKAQDVKLKEIAAELSRRLKIPILMTPIVEKHAITTNFSNYASKGSGISTNSTLIRKKGSRWLGM